MALLMPARQTLAVGAELGVGSNDLHQTTQLLCHDRSPVREEAFGALVL